MTNAEKKFTKKFNQRFAKKQDELSRIAAVMGNNIGELEVPDFDSFVYVTIGDKSVPVFNNRVANQKGTAVWVGYSAEEPTLLQVLSTRSSTPAGNSVGFMGYAPAKRYEHHAIGGGQDPLAVHMRAFTPLKLSMSSKESFLNLWVNLYRGFIYTSSGYMAIARQDLDLMSHRPTTAGKAALVLITINNSGTVVQTKGSEVNIADLAITDLPEIPANTVFVCGAVRVYTEQTVVQEGRTNTDFVDLRFPGVAGFALDYPAPTWDEILNKPTEFNPDLDVTNPLYAARFLKNADPTVNDDTTLGYKKLDIWLNQSTNQIFICVDETDGAAVWLPVGSSSGDVIFKVDGRLAVTTSADVPYLVTRDLTINSWYIYCVENGSASSTIVDVHKNGTTIFTTQGNRPTLAHDDANNWAVSGTPEVTTFVEGDVISIDIDQIATGAEQLVIIGVVASAGAASGSFNLTVTDGNTTVENVGRIEVPKVTNLGGGQISIGVVTSITTVQTRTQGTYSAPTTGDGTAITPLDIVLTPMKAGNKIILEWVINYESNQDVVFIVTRNGTKLANATDGSNNRWAGIASAPYDNNDNSTLANTVVKIVDESSLDVESTYSLLVRSSHGTAHDVYLNRTVISTGADQLEATLSVATAIEINT